MHIRQIAGALGAEVTGIDLTGELDESIVHSLRRAWLEHCVIFFRRQQLSPAKFLKVAAHFGTPIEYPFVKGIDGFPQITPVVKLEHESVNFGGVWHSDTTYLETPPMGTMLLALEVPPAGGDTVFASQYAAYEGLSKSMRELLAGMIAVNSSAKADVTRSREDRMKTDAREDARREFTAEHPVVRTHPETGRKALYVNPGHTVRFKDMTAAESAPLLDFLYRHQTRPEFTCRVRWAPGTLTVWDNRCTQHNAINDYHGQRRRMRRLTVGAQTPR